MNNFQNNSADLIVNLEKGIRVGNYSSRSFPRDGWIHPCFYCDSLTSRVIEIDDVRTYGCKNCISKKECVLINNEYKYINKNDN